MGIFNLFKILLYAGPFQSYLHLKMGLPPGTKSGVRLKYKISTFFRKKLRNKLRNSANFLDLLPGISSVCHFCKTIRIPSFMQGHIAPFTSSIQLKLNNRSILKSRKQILE